MDTGKIYLFEDFDETELKDCDYFRYHSEYSDDYDEEIFLKMLKLKNKIIKHISIESKENILINVRNIDIKKEKKITIKNYLMN